MNHSNGPSDFRFRVTNDKMEPKVKVTERIRELLKHAVLKSGIDSEDKKQMKCILEDKLSNIPFNLVLKAWNLVKKGSFIFNWHLHHMIIKEII